MVPVEHHGGEPGPGAGRHRPGPRAPRHSTSFQVINISYILSLNLCLKGHDRTTTELFFGSALIPFGIKALMRVKVSHKISTFCNTILTFCHTISTF